MSTSGPPPPFWPLSAIRIWRRSLTRSDSHGIGHRRRRERRDAHRLAAVGHVDHRHARVLAIRVGHGGRVVGAGAAGAVGERRRRPVAAFVLRLADERQVAVEAAEAGGAQRRRHLPLERRLRLVAARAGRHLRHRQRHRAGILRVVISGAASHQRRRGHARQRCCRERIQSMQAISHDVSSSGSGARPMHFSASGRGCLSNSR